MLSQAFGLPAATHPTGRPLHHAAKAAQCKTNQTDSATNQMKHSLLNVDGVKPHQSSFPQDRSALGEAKVRHSQFDQRFARVGGGKTRGGLA